jgi:hypothetical protein
MVRSRKWFMDKKLWKMGGPNPDDDRWKLARGAGKTEYSKAARALMPPENAKVIDPNSDEGKAIAERLRQN